jgi:glycosyltransferase involved in cell wall biosynthesis
MSSKIAVIVPGYKAEKSIARVISGIPHFVSFIIVVDDKSPDSLAEVVLSVAKNDSRIHLVRHEMNQGVGGATVSGYLKARELGAQVWVKMDADDQMDPSYIPLLVAPLISGDADYIKGNRFLHRSQLSEMPLVRRVGNFGLSFLTKIASGLWDIFDPTNGYTAISESAFSHLDTSRISKRFFFESSMLIELGVARAVVKDISIPARYADEQSNLSSLKAFFTFPPRLLRGLFHRIWQQYYLRDFGLVSILLPFSILFLSFGMIFGSVHWYLAVQQGVSSPSGTVVLAALPIILGVQCLLQVFALDIQNAPKDPISALKKRREEALATLFRDKPVL